MPPAPGRLHRLLREPLVHFLILGAGLFGVAHLTGSTTRDTPARVIRVDDRALARFVVQQRPELTPETAPAYVAALGSDERRTLIERLIQEEALVREARSLGLAQHDPVVRQRLVHKLQQLHEGASRTDATPHEDTLRAFFARHREQYREPARLTFAHIFFDNRQGGRAAARERALAQLATLDAQPASFTEGPPRGDPYHYQPAYVQRSEELIARHFSRSMAAQLFALPVGADWQGPLESPYGQHLVLIRQQDAAGVPAFADVRARVGEDWRRQQADQARRAAVRALVERYTVVIDLDTLPDAPR